MYKTTGIEKKLPNDWIAKVDKLKIILEINKKIPNKG
jgi:hypothetical protein